MTRTVGNTRAAKKKADVLFSKIVRARGACERCGENDYTKLQTAHIISRRFSNTRCDLANAFALCAKCHHFFTDHPVAFGEFVIAKIGRTEYERLFALARPALKFDWVAEVERLKAIARELEAA